MNRRWLLIVPVIAILAIMPLYGLSQSKDQGGTPPSAAAVPGDKPAACAASGESVGCCHHGFSLHALMEKLGITDEQKVKIRAAYVAFRDNTRKARTELFSIRDEKKSMLLSGKVDQQKLAKLDDQAVKAIGEVVAGRLKLHRDRLGLLTQEQRSRIAEWHMGMKGDQGWKGRSPHGKHSFIAMAEHLGLTADQKKQARDLFVAYRERTHKTRMELMGLKDEKFTMFLSDKADPQKLSQIDDQIVKLVTEKVREKLKFRRDRLALLTADQMGRMADWQAERAFHARMKGISHEGRHCSCQRD